MMIEFTIHKHEQLAINLLIIFIFLKSNIISILHAGVLLTLAGEINFKQCKTIFLLALLELFDHLLRFMHELLWEFRADHQTLGKNEEIFVLFKILIDFSIMSLQFLELFLNDLIEFQSRFVYQENTIQRIEIYDNATRMIRIFFVI